MSFLSKIFNPDDIVEIRCIHPDRKGSNPPKSFWVKFSEIKTLGQKVVELNKAGYGIYYGLLPREKDGSSKDSEVLPGGILWADFDHVTVDDAIHAIQESPLPEASIMVNSGHGAHAYWLLEERIDPWKISSLVGKIAEELKSDTSVRNPSRIFRLPNTINTKPPAAKCEVVSEYDETFKESDFLFTEKPKQKYSHPDPKEFPFNKSEDKNVQRASAYICKIPGSGAGGRTDAAFKVACVLVNDFSLSDGDCLDLLSIWDSRSNTPPIQGDDTYRGDELQNIINNAKRYSKKPGGTKREEEKRQIKSAKVQPDKPAPGLAEYRAKLNAQKSAKVGVQFKRFTRISGAVSLGRPGQLVIIAGPEGEGKSLFTTNLCLDAWSNGAKFAYLPLEDTRIDWQARALAIMSGSWAPIGHLPGDAEESLRLADTFGSDVDDASIGVVENPTKCDSVELEADVPLVGPHTVLEWVYNARKENDIIVVDCLSQIEFEDATQHRGESRFIKKLEALAKDKIIFLVCHTRRKDSKERKATPHGDDVQGSKMILRRCQACLMLLTHDMNSSDIYKSQGMTAQVDHERTVYVTKARNGNGKNQAFAVTMLQGGKIDELGSIKKF